MSPIASIIMLKVTGTRSGQTCTMEMSLPLTALSALGQDKREYILCIRRSKHVTRLTIGIINVHPIEQPKILSDNDGTK
jgi:hypothetical protein